MNELMTKLFVEQPWLHLNYVCDFMPHTIVYVCLMDTPLEKFCG